jgi:hypothetical protein
MKRKNGRNRVVDNEAGHSAAPSPTSAMVTPTSDVAAALLDLAEELGRLLARRELAKPSNRRGYSLPELLLGAAVMALAWVLVARALGLLPP